MSRWIDADAVKNIIRSGVSTDTEDDQEYVCGLIDEAPTIDAIPIRPQGEWFKDDEGTFICSACGSGYKDQPTLMGKPMFKWCPICGCRMKGTDDE